MEFCDDDLTKFEAEGATPEAPDSQGYVEHEGAKIWYATYGSGSPVILLHGGLGHSGNWSHQLPDPSPPATASSSSTAVATAAAHATPAPTPTN
jgi:hypothetical protein